MAWKEVSVHVALRGIGLKGTRRGERDCLGGVLLNLNSANAILSVGMAGSQEITMASVRIHWRCRAQHGLTTHQGRVPVGGDGHAKGPGSH